MDTHKLAHAIWRVVVSQLSYRGGLILAAAKFVVYQIRGFSW
jgi:hypothetical protein